MVPWMYTVEMYQRVRPVVTVEGMRIRETARTFGLHRDTVRKMLAYSVLQGYRRQTSARRPNPLRQAQAEAYTGVIDQILEKDHNVPQKQCHTAKRIFERLRDEYGFGGGYTTVKDYVREHRRRSRELFVPFAHPPGHAQCDFGGSPSSGSGNFRDPMWVSTPVALSVIHIPNQRPSVSSSPSWATRTE